MFKPWVRKIACSRKRHPSPVFVPGKFHGQRSLVGHSPWAARSQIQVSDGTCLITSIAILWGGQQRSRQTRAWVHSPPKSPPIQVATQHGAEIPVLPHRSLLVIRFECSRVHMLIPNPNYPSPPFLHLENAFPFAWTFDNLMWYGFLHYFVGSTVLTGSPNLYIYIYKSETEIYNSINEYL